MVKNERHSYLEKIQSRYKKGERKEKSKILDEFCEVCGYHRKYALRLLSNTPKRRKAKLKKRGRKAVYESAKLLDVIKTIWFAADQPCSKKLKVAILLWLPHYETEYELLDDEMKLLLESISAATLDRRLKPVRVKHKRKGIGGTKPGSLLKNQIPIKTDNWDVKKPGFVEADTVAHCGNSLQEEHAWSLTLTDIHTCWTENRALWGKGSGGVIEQIKDIEEELPFKLLGFDCDNGSEFLNYHLTRYFRDRPKKRMVQFTRSRPYHKNDNAHVEQKNWTHVRQLFGYDRIDNQAAIALMNELYKNEWRSLQNFFMPSMKLIEKVKINSKYRKQYDQPKTPYQRILESPDVTDEIKEKLIQKYNQLNPFELKRSIEKKLKNIFRHIKISSSVKRRI